MDFSDYTEAFVNINEEIRNLLKILLLTEIWKKLMITVSVQKGHWMNHSQLKSDLSALLALRDIHFLIRLQYYQIMFSWRNKGITLGNICLSLYDCPSKTKE